MSWEDLYGIGIALAVALFLFIGVPMIRDALQSRRRRVTEAATPAPRPLASGQPIAALPAVSPSRDWLAELVDTRHALVIGQSGAGKTVLTHAVAMLRARRGDQVLVCDPDARPGMWPGCTAVGGGDDYPAIEAQLRQVVAEVERRRKARAEGQREFGPLTLVLSEAGDIMSECPSARPLFESMLRRARKLNASLLVDVQDDQASTLDLEGATQLKKNFSMVLDLRLEGKKRVARIDKQSYEVPQLPDPEALADAHARANPPPTERPAPAATADAERLLRQVLDQPVPVRRAAAGAESTLAAAAPNQYGRGTADTSAVSAGSAQFSTSELVRLLASQREGGDWRFSANQIATLVGGTRSQVLDQVRVVREPQVDEPVQA